MTQRMTRRTVIVVIAAVIASITMMGIAAGHSGDQSYVYLDIFDESIEGSIHYPVEDLNEVLGLDIPDDPEGATAWAEANPEIIGGIIAKHEILQQFFHNGWVNLVAIDPETFTFHRYNTDATWEPVEL